MQKTLSDGWNRIRKKSLPAMAAENIGGLLAMAVPEAKNVLMEYRGAGLELCGSAEKFSVKSDVILTE